MSKGITKIAREGNGPSLMKWIYNFLVPNKKGTKEVGIGEALRAKVPSPMYPSRRIAIRPPKMYRFSEDCKNKN